MKAKIDSTQKNGKYWFCGDRNETVHKRIQQTGSTVIQDCSTVHT